jgi:class 3 adenylate cyclase
MDDATRQGLGPDIVVEERGTAELKGIAEPVRIFSVKGMKGA